MNFTANRCQKLPLNAKFEKVGSEKWLKLINTEIDRWFDCRISQLKSKSQKLTNQIESQSSVSRIESLNHRITPKNAQIMILIPIVIGICRSLARTHIHVHTHAVKCAQFVLEILRRSRIICRRSMHSLVHSFSFLHRHYQHPCVDLKPSFSSNHTWI